MRTKLLFVIFLLLTFQLLSGFAFYHHYGPFMGKVIDAETKEPIEGAAVLAVYYTVFSGPAGQNDNYTNAQETLTDENGEFRIPPLNDFTFRPLQRHADYVDFTIFKPGYGTFGGTGSYTGVMIDGQRPRNSFLHNDQYVVIELPKLQERKERLKNLRMAVPGSDIPNQKRRTINSLISIEEKELGL